MAHFTDDFTRLYGLSGEIIAFKGFLLRQRAESSALAERLAEGGDRAIRLFGGENQRR